MRFFCQRLLLLQAGLFSAISVAAPPSAQYDLLLLPDQQKTVDELEVPGTERSELPGVEKMETPSKVYLILDRVASYEKQIAARLASIHRYDSDISIHFGSIWGEFLHLFVSGPDAGTAIYISGEPPLFMQVRKIAKSEPGLRGTGILELREFKFPFEKCSHLASSVAEIVSALQTGFASIGTRPPPKDYWVLDGAYYYLKVRLHDTEVAAGVGGNSELLFEPINSAIQLVRRCVDDGLDFTVRQYELANEIVKERLISEGDPAAGQE